MHVCLSLDNFVTIKFYLQDGSAAPSSDSGRIEPLPGLETILEELLQEDGYVPITVLNI
jgi:hypothetical protein